MLEEKISRPGRITVHKQNNTIIFREQQNILTLHEQNITIILHGQKNTNVASTKQAPIIV